MYSSIHTKNWAIATSSKKFVSNTRLFCKHFFILPVKLIKNRNWTFWLKEKEDKGDDEEPSANIVPKWKAGQVTAIHLKTEEDMEEEEEAAKEQTEGRYRTKLDMISLSII